MVDSLATTEINAKSSKCPLHGSCYYSEPTHIQWIETTISSDTNHFECCIYQNTSRPPSVHMHMSTLDMRYSPKYGK